MSELVAYNVNCFAQVEGFAVNLPFLGKQQLNFGLPLVGVSWDFELNGIPTASCQIGIGADIRSGGRSTIHDLADHLTQRRRVKVIATFSRIGQQGKMVNGFGIPDKQQVTIFDGFSMVGGFGRSVTSANYQLNLEHWISDLNFASIFSQSSHPANPAQYSFGAILGGDETGVRAWTNLSQADRYIDINALQNDFWSDGIKKWFLHLCERDLFAAWEPRYIARDGQSNSLAKAAIDRIVTAPGSALKLDIAADNELVSAIASAIADATQDPGVLAQQTIWDLLIGRLAPEFLFGVIPRINDAYVAPYVPGHREPYKTITLDENTAFEWNRGSNRQLAGVGVTALLGMEAGGDQTKDGGNSPDVIGIGGFYPTDDKKAMDTGTIMILPAPAWANTMMAFTGRPEVTGGAAGAAPIPNVLVPKPGFGGAMEMAAQVLADAKNRAENVVKPFFDRYAQTLYSMMVTRGRQAIVSSPLRFDIAPGSTVRVEAPASSGGDQLGVAFYGTVVRTSGTLFAEPAQAGTGFHLANIRTASEQDRDADAVSVAKHPLYTETFGGCGLL